MMRRVPLRLIALLGVTLLRGRVRFACIELSTGKPRRLPTEFIEGYGPAVFDLNR